MGNKRLDIEATAREGEPVLASAIVRPAKPGKDAVLSMVGLIPVVGDIAESFVEGMPVGDEGPKAPVGYKVLNISLPIRMYLTLSANIFTFYSLGRYGNKMQEPVFVVPRSYVTGITTGVNWGAIYKQLVWLTAYEGREMARRVTLLISAGASIELQSGSLQLNEAAALIFATGDERSIRKMQEALQGKSQTSSK